MPRPHKLHSPEDLSPEGLRPLVGADGPTLASALNAITTWGTSTRFREQLMAQSDFPLPGDLPGFLLVNQLIYRGVARPTDLADAIDTGRSNVSKVVVRLEQAGLVIRVADPADNRAVAVALTDDGRRAGRRILATIESLYAPAADQWSRADSVALERLLVKLATSLDATRAHPRPSAAGVSFSDAHPGH